MTAQTAAIERRAHGRLPARTVRVSLRSRGSLRRRLVEVLDYNRHGMALLLEAPLTKDQLLYLRLHHGDDSTDNVVAVVHNCLRVEAGYRCGVRFRLNSELQRDAAVIKLQLEAIEQALTLSSEESAGEESAR